LFERAEHVNLVFVSMGLVW